MDHRTLCNYFIKQRNMLRLLVSYDTRWASQVVVVVKNLPANAGDIRNVGLITGLGESPGGRTGNPLWYSCLENSMDRGAWQG